ncbi:hypothetical protein [Falsirhodobacter xinxiangensis]|uniref:hypothetical protein n=1 Tax=Falsirhodobacter xinxiangensis TaxID=2530049 RepID=UPI0010AA8AAF|nr:hypothetical protein [Rhodobacter xinxiangensis]
MARMPVNTDLGAMPQVQAIARPLGIAAPVAQVAESPLLSLANSLSAIRPEIQGFIQGAQDDYRAAEETRAYDTIQGMTYDQARGAVSKGTMRKTESPWYRAAFQKQFGMAHAANRKREIITAYNNEFDKEGGNLDEFLAGYAQQDYEAYGESEFIASGVREGMAGVFNDIRNQHAEYRDTQLQARSVDQFYTLAGAAVDNAVTSGADIGATLTRLYTDHESALGMTPGQLDAEALKLADRYADEGNLAAVEAILAADPVGRGSFASRSGYVADVARMRETVKANQGKADRAGNVMSVVELRNRAANGTLDERDVQQMDTFVGAHSMTAAEKESLLYQNANVQEARVGRAFEANLRSNAMDTATALVTSGAAHTVASQTVINPHTGGAVTLDAEEMVQAVVDEQLTAMAAQSATPQVMASQLASWGVGATYEPWEKVMSDGYLSLGPARIRAGENGNITIPAPAQTAFQLWKAMAHEPRLRDRHVKDATAAAIYRDAEVLEKTGGHTTEEALSAAAGIDRKNSRSNLATQLDRNKFHEAVRRASGSLDWLGGRQEYNNAGFVSYAIEEHARILMDLGLPMENTIREAAEAFSDSHSEVMGVVYNNRDVFVPTDFDKIASATVQAFAESNDLDADDLTLIPAPGTQNYWTIVDELLQPVANSLPIHISRLQIDPNAFSMGDANEEIEAWQTIPDSRNDDERPVAQ